MNRNTFRWMADDRLNIHAYPADSVGAAIDRLMFVGFVVTNGYQDGVVRMARRHRNGNQTFCFVEPTGKVGPMMVR